MSKSTRKLFLCSLLMTLFCVSTYAQQRTITGRVTNPSGEALIGVSVIGVGTNVGASTDVNGRYSITVPATVNELKADFIGMDGQVKAIEGNQVDFVLAESSTRLDDVVVIGYGATAKKDLTGAVSQVDAKTLENFPVASSLHALAGRMPGVNITVTEGSPDADIKVRVRGGGSITQDNSPLYIVDGFEVASITNIPITDIESIVVLKDASSTAIYGAQGANGVFLVTTKAGKEGRTTVTFNTHFGISNVYNMYDVLSPYDYIFYQKELDPGASDNTSFYTYYGKWEDRNIWKSVQGTDWQDELYGNTGFKQNYNLTLTGGVANMKYRLSLTHDEEDYIMLNSARKMDNIDLKLNKTINEYVSAEFGMRMSTENVSGPSISSGRKLTDAVKYAPVYSLTTMGSNVIEGEDDTSVEALSSLNVPTDDIVNEYKKQKKFSTTYNAGVTWKILPSLSFRTQGSYTFLRNYTDNIWTNGTGESNANGGQPVAKRTDVKGDRWNFTNTLTYDWKSHDDHRLKVMLGQEMKHNQDREMINQSKFYPSDLTAADVLAMWNLGTSQPTYTTIKEPTRTFSFFGRAEYIYKDRYLLTVTAREDAKNVFAPGNRWGFFPSAAVAWRLSEENFLKSTEWLSNLKLRFSYGAAGNANVGSYWRKEYGFESTANRLYYPNEMVASGLKLSQTLYNDKLTWETKISSNLGIDYGFLGERISGSIEFYKDVTKDLIMGVALPSYSGYTTQYQNVGQTSNRGIEFNLNAYIIDKPDFSLSANFNIAFNKNRVDKFVGDNGNFSLYSSGWGLTVSAYDYMIQEGQPVGLMYGYVTDGYYGFDDFTYNETTRNWELKEYDSNGNKVPNISTLLSNSGNYFAPGHLKFKDLNGDGVIDDSDRKVIGRAQPLHTGGFGFTAQWKGIDVQGMFNWSYGNDIYNANKIQFTSYSGSKRYQNLSTMMSQDKRFVTIDPETGYNLVYGTYADPTRLQEVNAGATMWSPLMNNLVFHSWAVEDGSFLRFSNLTLGYTFPQKISRKVGMSNLRVYATANNLYLWTNYSGQDPEVDTRRSTPLTPGVDYSAYPKSRTFVFGLNVQF